MTAPHSQDVVSLGRRVVAAAAERHRDSVGELVAEVVDRLRVATPAFFADRGAESEMVRAADANLRRLHAQLLHLADDDAEDPLALATEEGRALARGAVRHGVALAALIEAYRAAQSITADWWRHRIAAESPDQPTLLAALDAFHEAMTDFADAAIAEGTRAYEQESERWAASGHDRRRRLIGDLLARVPLAVDDAGRALNHDLRGAQLAFVAWVRDFAAEIDVPAELDAVARAAADAAGAARALTLPAGESGLWGWVVPAPEASATDVAARLRRSGHPAVAVGLGCAGRAIDGFRRSHAEALEAQRLALLSPRRPRVTAYHDVELVALLSRDRDALRTFVRRTLGPLAADTADARRLRETLHAYLATGSSAAAAARRLDVHRNTIVYRLRAIDELVGTIDPDDELRVELALEVCETLGPPPGA